MASQNDSDQKIKKDLFLIIGLIAFFTLLFIMIYIYNQKTGQLACLASDFYQFLIK